MPQDIFISYSSKDREQAEQLEEMLSSAGLSVWIDRVGIDAATRWSEEIVDAIDSCRAFVLILSSSSIESHNVIKELSLLQKSGRTFFRFISNQLKYRRACNMLWRDTKNVDEEYRCIIRALEKLGLKATSAPNIKLVKETDSRKSLMILPFDDLSPTADNQWFCRWNCQ